MLIQSITVIVVAFVVSWLTTKGLIPLLLKRGLIDIPNGRSSHQVPTPRGGGIGIIAGISAGLFTAWLLEIPLISFELMIGAAIIAGVGFVDDRMGGLRASLRFVLQSVAAGIVVYRFGGLTWLPLPEPFNVSLGFLAIPMALLWILVVTNIYNFLDGIDGFAAVQGASVGLAIAFLGDGVFTSIGFAVAGACTGFALHNWHPAKVFMGDVGSGTLGFLLAALPFQLSPGSRSTIVMAIVIFLWFFLSDGVFTIARRLIYREKIWTPHRTHLYQRLVKTGLRHDQVVLKVIGGTLLLSVMATTSARLGDASAWWIVIGAALISFLLYCRWTWVREKLVKGNA
jgi:Fuc2NAc and GlcNAc transferase